MSSHCAENLKLSVCSREGRVCASAEGPRENTREREGAKEGKFMNDIGKKGKGEEHGNRRTKHEEWT